MLINSTTSSYAALASASPSANKAFTPVSRSAELLTASKSKSCITRSMVASLNPRSPISLRTPSLPILSHLSKATVKSWNCMMPHAGEAVQGAGRSTRLVPRNTQLKHLVKQRNRSSSHSTRQNHNVRIALGNSWYRPFRASPLQTVCIWSAKRERQSPRAKQTGQKARLNRNARPFGNAGYQRF